jgi:SAM-dependent methyltransferase
VAAEEDLQEPAVKESARGWQEFWAEFFRIKHRHSIKNIEDFDKTLVSHIIEVLSLRKGNRVLDLACGGGDQARELARRGMEVVGVDIAQSLVDYGNRAAGEENLKVQLICGDMRDERFNTEFDSCIVVGAFGFFNHEGNRQVLDVVKAALKKDGGFYIQGPNPLTRMRRPWKSWHEMEDGYVLMESNYDPSSGKTTDGFFYIRTDGELTRFSPKPEDAGFSLETRLYTLPEMADLLKTASLQPEATYGSLRLPPEEYTVASEHLIVVGKKV